MIQKNTILVKTALTILLLIPLVLFLIGLRAVEGCPPEGKMAGCYGPIGTYWTIWDAQLAFQSRALFFSVIGAAISFALSLQNKWRMTSKIMLAVSVFLWMFLTSIILRPEIIQY